MDEFINGIMTTFDAKQYLGVSKDTIKNWVKKGYISCERTKGGHMRFNRAEIERMKRICEDNERRKKEANYKSR